MTSPPLPGADEVDAITAAWQSVLPGLDVAPMHVFSRLDRVARQLESLRRATFAAHDLTRWQFDVLAALRRVGDPYELTPGGLVAATRVSSGTMTNRIDRLLQRALVDRRGWDGDRRIVLVRLTAAGRRAVDSAMADLVDRERRLLAGLAPQDVAALATGLRSLLARTCAVAPAGHPAAEVSGHPAASTPAQDTVGTRP